MDWASPQVYDHLRLFGTPQNQNVGHTACGISPQLGLKCDRLCVSGSGSVGSLIERVSSVSGSVAMLLPTAHLVGHLRTRTWDTQLVALQSLGWIGMRQAACFGFWF